MPYITLQNYRLFYATHEPVPRPSTPPLVLVHGAGGTHLHWPPEIRRLPEMTVYALDLPGHGRSEGRGCRSIATYRDIILQWADTVGLSQFVLAGHSMGGAIAQELALTFPHRLRGLILVATGARLKVHPQILQGLERTPEATARLLAEWAYGERPPHNLLRLYVRRLLEIPPEVTLGDFLACDAWDRMDDIHRIEVPTLIVAGEADKLTPPKYARYLQERIPCSQLVLVPKAGHMVMLEAPTVVAHAISDFIHGLPLERGAFGFSPRKQGRGEE